MKKNKPITLTLQIIAAWILLAFLYMLIAPDEGSEKTFAILVYAFYLAPVVGILSFSIYWVTNKRWFSEHKVSVVIFYLLLLVWLFSVIYYLKDLLF